MLYEPHEDSFLLAEQVRRFAKGKVLDMGTGTGILARVAKEAGAEVVTADINPEAKQDEFMFIQSDLFEKISGRFDLIVFNPPYLPNDEEFFDIALHGGETGRETLDRFLEQARNHLKKGGSILFVQSSITDIKKTQDKLKQLRYSYEILSKKHLFMEELVVFRAWLQ
ncbi:MAG: methyltransferase [Candidatus Diapherotrites archaeon]|nr:methyltransferase [Candidatus Diapherotrites archaeon]